MAVPHESGFGDEGRCDGDVARLWARLSTYGARLVGPMGPFHRALSTQDLRLENPTPPVPRHLGSGPKGVEIFQVGDESTWRRPSWVVRAGAAVASRPADLSGGDPGRQGRDQRPAEGGQVRGRAARDRVA